jgi:RNA polymerase primary sigma factor
MNQREPSEEELIDALEKEYGIKVLNRVDVVKIKTTSMDERVSSDGESDTLGEVGEVALATASRNGCERAEELEEAEYQSKRLMRCLSFREQQVVCRKFGIGYDREQELEEIADALGYTAERCRQILKEALAKMKRKQANSRAM